MLTLGTKQKRNLTYFHCSSFWKQISSILNDSYKSENWNWHWKMCIWRFAKTKLRTGFCALGLLIMYILFSLFCLWSCPFPSNFEITFPKQSYLKPVHFLLLMSFILHIFLLYNPLNFCQLKLLFFRVLKGIC